MAYGVNKPNGLVPRGYQLGSLPSSGLASTSIFSFQIASGYAQNIGLGDPVFWEPAATGDGYIVAATDASNVTVSTGVSVTISHGSILGVFAGCQYNSDDEVLPYPPMKLSWKAGTVTADGQAATAFVIPATYQAGFSVQTDSTGCLQKGLLQMGTLTVTLDANDLIVLNGDASTAYLGMTSGIGNPYATTGTPYTSLQVIGFDNTIGYAPQSASQVGLAYGNVIVRIADSPFPTFSTAGAF